MRDIGEAARQRAARALTNVIGASFNTRELLALVDIVITTLTEPHPALGAAAEVLRKWNIAAPDGSMRFTTNSADCTYVTIAAVVLDAAAEHEATTAPVERDSPASNVSWVPQVGDKVQWSRCKVDGEDSIRYGEIVDSTVWVLPPTFVLLAPEDSPECRVPVRVVDVMPDQRPQATDELYVRIRAIVKSARHTLLSVIENPTANHTNACNVSAKELIDALAALAELAGKPYTCHMRGCTNPIPVEHWCTVCSAHGHGNE